MSRIGNKMMKKESPIILLSGMGADARIFEKQMKALPTLRVPAWVTPLPHESLSEYAIRFAAEINPGELCFIGGASFGGFVALEMLNHLDVKACFLIGSVRSPSEFPRRFKVLNGISQGMGTFPFETAILLSKLTLLSSGSRVKGHWSEIIAQLSESDALFLKWACRAVLEWSGVSHAEQVPVYQIHGDKDFVLPIKNTKPDRIVYGAGHALSMSHPDAVTTFLKDMMERHVEQSASSGK